MTYSPPEISLEDPVFVGTLGPNSIGNYFHSTRQAAPTSVTWVQANTAMYYPFWLNAPYLIQRWWWLNGTVVGTNNFQAGVYDENWSLVASCTSTLSAGTASQVQYVTPGSPQAIPKMRGYLALWCNGTTASVFTTAGTMLYKPHTYRQTSGLGSGLAATATPIASAVTAVPVFGFTRRASP